MTNPYLEVILAATIWGTTGVFVKILDLPSTTITFFRLAIPTIILFFYLTARKTNLLTTTSLPLLGISLINAARLYFYFVAFSLTTIGNAVIMLYTWPIFAVIFSHLLLKEKISGKKIAIILLLLLGIILMFANHSFSFTSHDFLGMLSMLICAVGTGLLTPLFKSGLEKYSKTETIFYQNILGALLVTPFFIFNYPLPTFNQTIIATGYGLLVGGIAFILFFAGLKKLKASTAALLSYVEVLVGVLLGILLFHETITLYTFVGGGLIILCSYLIRLLDTRQA